jgi:hypothetical protein
MKYILLIVGVLLVVKGIISTPPLQPIQVNTGLEAHTIIAQIYRGIYIVGGVLVIAGAAICESVDAHHRTTRRLFTEFAKYTIDSYGSRAITEKQTGQIVALMKGQGQPIPAAEPPKIDPEPCGSKG